MSNAQSLTPEEYLKNRVQDQLQWFEKKSAFNQKRYKRLKTIILVFSVAIPLLSGFLEEGLWWLKILIGVAGLIIAVGEGLLSIHKYQENWIQYRATAETLKREEQLFLTGSGVYHEADKAFPHFVIQVEAIISNDVQNWQQYIQKED